MLNKSKTKKEGKTQMKNLVVSAMKENYYTASALVVNHLKDADIAIGTADRIHEELAVFEGKAYAAYYIIGVRLKKDYEEEIYEVLKKLSAGGKIIRWYLMDDRMEASKKYAELLKPFVRTVSEKDSITAAMIRDFKITGEDSKRLNELYELCEKCDGDPVGKAYRDADENIRELYDYIRSTKVNYWKWHVGRHEVFFEMINRLAFNTVTESDINTSVTEDDDAYLTGNSRVITELREKIQIVAPFSAPVLIYGQTGAGKDVAAKLIHQASGRRGNYLFINCAGLSKDLLESELFGYKGGAFTGSKKDDQPGLLEYADGGTLFLDEIASMNMDVQSKLLKFLDDFRYRPVGGGEAKKADVRIITASNVRLTECVKNGTFRRDLYYRISGVELKVPSLKERKEDIEELARVFVYRNYKSGHNRILLNKEEFEILESYDWPGNARQLKKFLTRAMIFNKRGAAMKGLLAEMAAEDPGNDAETAGLPGEGEVMTIAEAEKMAITAALKAAGYNKTKAKDMLGIGSVNTLKAKMEQYGIGEEPK